MTNPQILELNPSAHFFRTYSRSPNIWVLGIRLLYLLSKMTDKLDDSLRQIQTPHIYSIIYIHIYNIYNIYDFLCCIKFWICSSHIPFIFLLLIYASYKTLIQMANQRMSWDVINGVHCQHFNIEAAPKTKPVI